MGEYTNVHNWVRAKRGRPQECEHCGTTEKRRYDWSNKDHTYKRKVEDWQRLCRSCHKKYDLKYNLNLKQSPQTHYTQIWNYDTLCWDVSVKIGS